MYFISSYRFEECNAFPEMIPKLNLLLVWSSIGSKKNDVDLLSERLISFLHNLFEIPVTIQKSDLKNDNPNISI